MNKIQLIVAWITGLAISGVLILTPKIAMWKGDLILLAKDNKYSAPLVNWSLAGSFALAILIVGGLIICSLKNK